MGQEKNEQMDGIMGRFLVALPTLEDSVFERSVIFICAHSSEGSMGVMINRPHPASLDQVLDQVGIDWHVPGNPQLFEGGPVSPERGFILYRGEISAPGSLEVLPNLFLGTSVDVLKHLAHDQPGGEREFLMALGYAGWDGGQLEAELRANTWLVTEADEEILFRVPPEQRWKATIGKLGIDLNQLVDSTGSIN